MQLNLEHPDHEFFLRAADGESALVNQRRLTASFVLSPNRLVEDWSVREVKAITPEDLDAVLALEPEVVLLGSGATQAFPPAAVLAACQKRGVGLETMTNAAAARTYNVLASEDRRVVAAFVLPG
jgi:uncharacterized protein